MCDEFGVYLCNQLREPWLTSIFVTPAQAGVQGNEHVAGFWPSPE